MKASGLCPIHPSLLEKRSAYSEKPRPHGMSRMTVTAEQRQQVERIALDIFTDMANAGCSLQETLSAIYLSGLQNAVATMRGAA